MFLTLDNASELMPPTGWPGLSPIFGVWLDNVVSSCPLAPGAIACFGMLPMVVLEDVTVGWLINMTLEPGSAFVEVGVPFGKAIFVVEEEEGVTRMNLVTWDLSSELARFTPDFLINSAGVRTWETTELLSDGTTTVFFANEP